MNTATWIQVRVGFDYLQGSLSYHSHTESRGSGVTIDYAFTQVPTVKIMYSNYIVICS